MTKLVSTFVFKQKKIYSLFFISQLFCENILILNGKTKQPLPEVNVFSSNYGTTTDSNGTFSLIEFQDKESVVISHIGYEVKILKKNQFPEIMAAADSLPYGVYDGEILAWKDHAPLPFFELQKLD